MISCCTKASGEPKRSRDMSAGPSYTILIAGLGALGTVFATLLKEAGHRVFALARQNCRCAVADGNLLVNGIWGEHRARLDGIESSIDPLRREAFDLVILTVKSYDTESAIRQVAPLVGADTLVIVAQNGYGNYEKIALSIDKTPTTQTSTLSRPNPHAAGKAEVTIIAAPVRMG